MGECLTEVGGESVFKGGDIMARGEDFLLSGTGPGTQVRCSHIFPSARTRSTSAEPIERSIRVREVVLIDMFGPTSAVVDRFRLGALAGGFCMPETANGVLDEAPTGLLVELTLAANAATALVMRSLSRNG